MQASNTQHNTYKQTNMNGKDSLSVYCVCVLPDIRRMNSEAVFAKRTGMVIIGGGLVKHHICNANLMVGRLDMYI